MKHLRTVDPYRDLDVIDANAPRFNQAVIGTLAVVAFLTGWWPLLAILAAQLAIGLTLGRRWCLPCLAYFELVQPRIGEGPIEDSRPPRFANKVGVVFFGTRAGGRFVPAMPGGRPGTPETHGPGGDRWDFLAIP